MASGMNGQQFEFLGYLPIDNNDRVKAVKEMESGFTKKTEHTNIHRNTLPQQSIAGGAFENL
jgi:16S rRNA C1402 (ribose-2'-O) methylase RsmI